MSNNKDSFITLLVVLFIISLAVFGVTQSLHKKAELEKETKQAKAQTSEEPLVGAPDSQSTRHLYPFTANTYNLGTTSLPYKTLTINEVCLTADTCRTTWPSSGGGSGTIGTSTTPVPGQLAYWTSLNTLGTTPTTTLTETATGLELSGTPIVLGASPLTLALTAGYTIPLTASTTEWAAAYATSTALTPAYIRGLWSETVTGLSYNSGTGVLSLDGTYTIPLIASTTEWSQAYASTTALTPAYIRGLLSGTSPITFNSGTGAIGFDFSTNNTWTGNNIFGNSSSTNHTISNNLYLTGKADGCLQITGGLATSTGVNCGTGSGGSATTTINGVSGPTFTFATGTATGIGLTISTSTGTVTFTPTVSSGYVIPLTASTTEWAAAYATSTALTPAYIRGLFSNTATGLTYNSTTGATSLTAGYNIPLTASTTEWTNFYNTPSTRITAGTGLSWAGNTLNSVWTASGNNIFNNNSANVGVGTTSPEAKLHVGGANDATNVVKIGTPSANAGAYVGFQVGAGVSAYRGSIGYDAGGQKMIFRTGSNITVNNASQERMVIDVNGNVGIGTTTPSTKLHVIESDNNNYAMFSNASGMARMTIGADSSGNPIIRPRNNLDLYLTDDALNLGIVVKDGGGNVGVGTSTPAVKLVVSTGVTGPELILDGGANARGSSVAFYQNNLLTGWLGTSGEMEADSSTDVGLWAKSGSGLRFYTNGSTAERMFIDTSGNVGIGTSTPAHPLQVYVSNSTTATPIASLKQNSTGDAGLMYLLNGANSFVTGIDNSDSDSFKISYGSAGNAAFGTNDYLTITTAGLAGIGTTTPSARLHVVGTDTSTPFLKVGSSTQDVLTVSAATSTRFSVGTTTTLYNLNFQGTMGMWGLANQQTTDSLCIMSATGTVAYFASNSCVASSIRFKENVENSTIGLKEILQLRPVSFNYKPGMGDQSNQLGLIAEEVAEVDPRFADYDKEGNPGTLDDFALISALVKAVQELEAGRAIRTAEENWQWSAILILLMIIYGQHRRLIKLEHAQKSN